MCCDLFLSQYLQSDLWIVSSKDLAEVLEPEDPFEIRHGGLKIERLIDWTATTVDVVDLQAWLRSKGFTKGFFFPAEQSEPDAFTDPAHEHFAPELALAVAAWRALSTTQSFKRGPKEAIAA